MTLTALDTALNKDDAEWLERTAPHIYDAIRTCIAQGATYSELLTYLRRRYGDTMRADGIGRRIEVTFRYLQDQRNG